jgi:hypothetical protein
MATIKRQEKVTIMYDGSKIIVRGKTFELNLSVNKMKLASVYMSGSGDADSTLSVTVPDVVTPVSATTVIQPDAEIKKTDPENKSEPDKKKVKTLAEIKANEVPHRYDPNG